MLQVTVTAKNSDVVLQDPFPADGMWSLTVPAGTSKSVSIAWDQFQRIAPQVYLLEQAGLCSVTIEAITGFDVRGQENDLVGMPAIDRVAKFAVALAGESDLEIEGDQLLAQQGIAHALVGDSATPNAQLDFYFSTPGVAGNDWSVEIVDTGGAGPIAVAVVGSKVTIDLVGVVDTAANIAASLNAAVAPAGTRGIFYVEGHGTGAGNVLVADETDLTGGSGAGMSVTLCGQPCIVVQCIPGALPADPQKVIVDTPDLTLFSAAGEAVDLYLRSDSKKTVATLSIA